MNHTYQMKTSIILFFLLVINNVYSFVSFPSVRTNHKRIYMINDYLEHINNHDDTVVKKFITTWQNDKKLDKGYLSTYKPIPKATFDTIFLNIYQINKIYMSASMDRLVFEIFDQRRFVFYIKDKDEYRKMMQLIDLIPNQIKIIIINDIHKCMDDPFGFLYCEPK